MIGRPGMPIKALFPTAAPVHDGAVTALKAVALGLVARTVNVSVDPSVSVKLNGCPAEVFAVASL